MRDTKSGGVIQQVTSVGGQRGVPIFSIYCASSKVSAFLGYDALLTCGISTEWAVEGFTEAVAGEGLCCIVILPSSRG